MRHCSVGQHTALLWCFLTWPYIAYWRGACLRGPTVVLIHVALLWCLLAWPYCGAYLRGAYTWPYYGAYLCGAPSVRGCALRANRRSTCIPMDGKGDHHIRTCCMAQMACWTCRVLLQADALRLALPHHVPHTCIIVCAPVCVPSPKKALLHNWELSVELCCTHTLWRLGRWHMLILYSGVHANPGTFVQQRMRG